MNCIEVAAGIILRGPYILIARRLADAHLGGLWEFPGGTLEPGETLEECLVREIREELNLTVRVGRRLLSVEEEYPATEERAGRQLRLHFFVCTPEAGTPEARSARMLQAHELDQFEFPSADQPVLQQLKSVVPS
jgi:mutator protein MutT